MVSASETWEDTDEEKKSMEIIFLSFFFAQFITFCLLLASLCYCCFCETRRDPWNLMFCHWINPISDFTSALLPLSPLSSPGWRIQRVWGLKTLKLKRHRLYSILLYKKVTNYSEGQTEDEGASTLASAVMWTNPRAREWLWLAAITAFIPRSVRELPKVGGGVGVRGGRGEIQTFRLDHEVCIKNNLWTLRWQMWTK